MTKEEFADCLREKGFKVADGEKSVNIVTQDKKDLDKIEMIAKESGYNGFYGWESETNSS